VKFFQSLASDYVFVLLWPYVHWSIAIGFTIVAVEALYFLAPNVKQRFLATLPGALLAVGCWLALSYLLGLYFRHFANFNKTYGTLGAGIALMTWLYWTGFAMLVGAELNSELAKIAARARSKRSMNLPRSQRLILRPEACIQNPDTGAIRPRMLQAFFRGAQRRRSPRGPEVSVRDLEQTRLKMRKRILARTLNSPPEQGWLDLERFASVEITSEDKAFPIESAVLPRDKGGWRAAEPGVQTIRLIFDEPQKLRRISVVFEETETKRTQEFTLRWSPDRGSSFREIVRQQWNFSSPDGTRETEDYAVDLSNVTLLDLTIEPDKENCKARASLLSLRLA
jgi:hypothetical protein